MTTDIPWKILCWAVTKELPSSTVQIKEIYTVLFIGIWDKFVFKSFWTKKTKSFWTNFFCSKAFKNKLVPDEYLELSQTSYVHPLVEKIEEQDDELEAIEARNRSALYKEYIQLELKKNWKENNLWKKKKKFDAMFWISPFLRWVIHYNITSVFLFFMKNRN